ncbi:hypothetical protein KC318_g14825 [Hortaea werneckii]|uniref:HNH domain-containing protein n=1 Tax=Hortaea werneckii TaxID=91943 RepID=A0A3M6ZFB0_HORWE|nr:hypothetical protein KC334_g14986 [Hortaea werneckii]KAI6946974.1 hypothetical protein KC355_g14952 [Hortaea werneckii]KAI7652611.1 hypothetical protein KC318_g14825 [Hortaea werneckii]RMY13986.1 hypothetical protein D0866_13998 [Hortaea werneckii]
MIPENETSSFDIFADCLSTIVIARLAPDPGKKRKVKGRRNEIKPAAAVNQPGSDELGDAGELSEFVQQYLAEELFTSLPSELRTLSYSTVQEGSALLEKYSLPLDTDLLQSLIEFLPPTISDSLTTYGLISDDASNLDRFFEPVLEQYILTTTSPPPEYTPSITASRPDGCEICDREHLPLTYHHLIPRQMHDKAVKRGWHKEWELNKVAWLCRACHSFVHRIASNEELARELFSVEALMEREDVVKWAQWVGRVRWKAR